MILVDTSTWIDHFRDRPTALTHILGKGRIRLHPFVWGELLLSGLPREGGAAAQLTSLLPAPLGSAAEAAAFIGWAALAGTGIGYVDAHLLVSVRMMPGGALLTEDRRLRAQAQRLGLGLVD